MSNFIYNYEEWLSGHANRKTMMQKLERSLVPYEIFEAVDLKNDKQERTGDVTIGANTYHYDIKYDYKCIGHDVYDADISVVSLVDRWNNILMGYNKFKVVMNHNNIKTIYSDHEDYFQQVTEMFEKDDYASLYMQRSSYINNLLARYILLRLLEVYRPELQLITSIETNEDGRIGVLAADANRNEWIMYSFSKRDAMEMAQRLDGCCRNLTVVYYFNQDFEKDGNIIGFDSGSTKVISARSFMMSFPLDSMERRLIEKRMLMLVSMLYNEHLEWHFDRVERVIAQPPYYGETFKEQKQNKKSLKAKSRKGKKKGGLVQLWYQKIPRTLLEDALNVLADKPTTHADIFHFLCAANLVNAYVNQCNHNMTFTTKQINRMFQAKQQMLGCVMSLAENKNPNVRISISPLPAVLVSIKIEKHDFQFSFRGMKEDFLYQLRQTGSCQQGRFDGYFLQPIASALYQYSYLLRWKGLNNMTINENKN